MKPRTYFGLALLFPYLLWGVCALIVFLLSSQEMSDAWNIVLMPVFFYAFGIILWLVPYTVLAIGMWVWSRDKPMRALYTQGGHKLRFFRSGEAQFVTVGII